MAMTEGSDEYVVDVEVSLQIRSEGERPSAARANAATDVKSLLDTLDRVGGMAVGTSMGDGGMMVECPRCDGSGRVQTYEHSSEVCIACSGNGEVLASEVDGDGGVSTLEVEDDG